MKRPNYKKGLVAGIMFIALSSCKKDSTVDPDKLNITADNLTSCPLGSTCSYLFTESADLVDNDRSELKTGKYRLFWFKNEADGYTSTVFIKAPMKGTGFELKKADLLEGKVVVVRSCLACLFGPQAIVDGYVKGVNSTPGKPADQAKWLLEGQVVLQLQGGSNNQKYTINFKQVFSANFVSN
ncbi:hypothetical protein MUY27_05480 [Mucilaginibacter sp. RS28]|uniref:Lipoprotein n=1 Tax=Mucilaginibacter straminoryzae TaxID=2932774 RepID=A0A9X1X5S3_9SPHI|nr:hypothetical protein [Mucilaginibacter straminoryzae]MCJ8209149.1 hypothetical protein [Mucilaginibacter straminoryzae]